MKILITGGHVTPALAVIDELLKKKDVDIIFVGRKYALSGDKNESFEFQEIKIRKIPFFNLNAGRFTLTSFSNVISIPRGFIEAFFLLNKEKPDRVLSFGGYIALPIAIWAYVLGIAVFTHEQVMIPGLTTKIIARFAKKVFITFPQSEKYLNKKNTVITGNPLREAIFKIVKTPFSIDKKSGKKVIYVTGGSLGAHIINTGVLSMIDKLLEKYIVIHQCGDATEYNDYEKLSRVKKPGYFIKKHFLDEEIGFIYQVADIVVSRSGANTILELIALQKPAILIPLPIARNDEQLSQAKLLQAVGAAEIVGQNNIEDNLIASVNKIAHSIDIYKKNYVSLQYLFKKDAASLIIANILK